MPTVFLPVVLIALSQVSSTTAETETTQQTPLAVESSTPKQERSVLIAPPDDYFSRNAKTVRLQQPKQFNQPVDAVRLSPNAAAPAIPLAEQNSSIAPASASNSSAPAPANTTTASQLLERALKPHSKSTLSGKKTTLLQALEQNSTSDLSAVIEAYWALSGAIAKHRYALEEVQFWNAFTPALEPSERAITATLRASAEADRLEAHRRAVAAQYRLAELIGQAKTETPPLPHDTPFLGAYNTNFSALFANRQAPAGLAEIAHTLPLSQQTIAARADAVVLGEDALAAVSDAYIEGLTPIEGVAASIARLRRNRLEFLEATIQYNQQIARYSIAAIGNNVSPQQLVSTLIETEPRMRSVLTNPGEIRAVSGRQEASGKTQSLQSTEDSEAQKAEFEAFRDVTPGRGATKTRKARLVPVLPLPPEGKAQQH